MCICMLTQLSFVITTVRFLLQNPGQNKIDFNNLRMHNMSQAHIRILRNCQRQSQMEFGQMHEGTQQGAAYVKDGDSLLCDML